MDALAIINKYYPEDNELKHILLAHSRSVADKALWIAGKHPELNLDKQFLEEAAMLHDIGIFMTDAEGICRFSGVIHKSFTLLRGKIKHYPPIMNYLADI